MLHQFFNDITKLKFFQEKLRIFSNKRLYCLKSFNSVLKVCIMMCFHHYSRKLNVTFTFDNVDICACVEIVFASIASPGTPFSGFSHKLYGTVLAVNIREGDFMVELSTIKGTEIG